MVIAAISYQVAGNSNYFLLKEGKIETAAKMKANGISLDVIAECTGLSEEEIQKL